MARARPNITIADRVDAALSAARIYDFLREDQGTRQACVENVPWLIVARLKEPAIDRVSMGESRDALLRARCASPWLTAWMRAEVCKLENALGLHHDDRSVAAFMAKQNSETWKAYIAQLEAEVRPAAIEITIPAGVAQ